MNVTGAPPRGSAFMHRYKVTTGGGTLTYTLAPTTGAFAIQWPTLVQDSPLFTYNANGQFTVNSASAIPVCLQASIHADTSGALGVFTRVDWWEYINGASITSDPTFATSPTKIITQWQYNALAANSFGLNLSFNMRPDRVYRALLITSATLSIPTVVLNTGSISLTALV